MIKKQPEVLVEIIKAKALWREGGVSVAELACLAVVL